MVAFRYAAQIAVLVWFVFGGLAWLGVMLGRQNPDAAIIAYSREEDLYLRDAYMRLDARLTRDGNNNHRPLWSPDGETLLFFSDRMDDDRTRYRVFLMDADGGNVRPLLPALNDIGALTGTFTWSPDSTKIAAQVFEASSRAIRTYQLDLTAQTITPLTPGKWTVLQQAPLIWEDAETVQTVRVAAQEYDVFRLRVDDFELVQTWTIDLTPAEFTQVYPALAPDGSAFVFASEESEGDGVNLWHFDLASGAMQAITRRTETRDVQPAWSPDGEQLAFIAQVPGVYNALVIMEPKGTDERVLFRTGSGIFDLHWADAERITFETDYDTGSAQFTLFCMISFEEKEPFCPLLGTDDARLQP